jgi:hypothetical protein
VKDEDGKNKNIKWQKKKYKTCEVVRDWAGDKHVTKKQAKNKYVRRGMVNHGDAKKHKYRQKNTYGRCGKT